MWEFVYLGKDDNGTLCVYAYFQCIWMWIILRKIKRTLFFKHEVISAPWVFIFFITVLETQNSEKSEITPCKLT